MLKKTLLATATSAALLGPLAAFAAGDMGQGTITFTGSVTEAPCNITGADTNLAVDLGQISKTSLTGTIAVSTSVPIEIHLNGCQFAAPATGATASAMSKLTVKFPGQTSTTGDINNGGNATGVTIQLLNANNTAVNLATGSTETVLVNGVNTVRLFARMKGAATVAAGSVTANVSYMLDYK